MVRLTPINLLFLLSLRGALSGSSGVKKHSVYTRVCSICVGKKSWPWSTFRFLFLPLLPALGSCWMDETILKCKARPTILGNLVKVWNWPLGTGQQGSWYWLVLWPKEMSLRFDFHICKMWHQSWWATMSFFPLTQLILNAGVNEYPERWITLSNISSK